jgi:2-polyprenyl-3-methyl-5-hydroxy-6-metoxy-1,4-benzoquinol methylase
MKIMKTFHLPTPPPIEWELAYDAPCSLYTHPLQLAAISQLKGHLAPNPWTARILEVGCATGGNLNPIASSLPEAECVGIDPFQAQIEVARQRASDMGLERVTYLPIGVEDIDSIDGSFDYIICHGLFSWVDQETQEATLKLCAERLTPNGLAYISFNTHPGWHINQSTRELMRWRGRHLRENETYIEGARKVLDLFSRYSTDLGNSSPKKIFESAHLSLSKQPDFYLAHEYMLEHNTPLYFHEFISKLAAHSLCHLSDGLLNTELASLGIGHMLQNELASLSPTPLCFHQYLDFIYNRTIRRTILTRASADVHRGDVGIGSVEPAGRGLSGDTMRSKVIPALYWERCRDLWFSSVQELDMNTLTHSKRARSTNRYTQKEHFIVNPLRRAIHLLLQLSWPHPMTLEMLTEQAPPLALDLSSGDLKFKNISKDRIIEALSHSLYLGLINPPMLSRIDLCPAPPTPESYPHPRVFKHLRCSSPSADASSKVASSPPVILSDAYHSFVPIDEEMLDLLPLLDGTRSWAHIADECGQTTEWLNAQLAKAYTLAILI